MVLRSIVRGLSGSSALCRGRYDATVPLVYKAGTKDMKYFEKLMLKGGKKERKNHMNDFALMKELPEKAPAINSKLSTSNVKEAWDHPRAKQLSSIFMEYVSDVLASGEVSQRLVDLDFEVSKVSMSHGFHTLHIHWVCTGDERANMIHKELPAAAIKLRYYLTRLHLMGHTPSLQFVQEQEESSDSVCVDRALHQASHQADDHQQLQHGHTESDGQMADMQTQPADIQTQPADIQTQSADIQTQQADIQTQLADMQTEQMGVDVESVCGDREGLANVSSLRLEGGGGEVEDGELWRGNQSIYGVTHGHLMQKLVYRKQRAMKRWREEEEEQDEEEMSLGELRAVSERNLRSKKALSKFLQKRKLENLRRKGVKSGGGGGQVWADEEEEETWGEEKEESWREWEEEQEEERLENYAETRDD